MRVSVRVCAALCWLCASGFSWPGSSARLVKELTSQTSPRDKRETLRLLRALYEQGEREPLLLRADLSSLVGDADPEVRLDALRLFAQVHHDPAAWRRAQDDVAPSVRAAALDALARLGDVDALLVGAEDTDASVRAAALRALAAASDVRVGPTLVRGLADGATEVRVAAALALGRHSEPTALAALLRYADDPLPELRAAVIDALRDSPELRARAALEAALEDADETVVLTALRGLLRHAEAALPARVSELAGERASPQLAAAARALLSSRARGSSRFDQRDARMTQAPAGATQTEPAWLPPLELTADHSLSLAQSERVLGQLEALLPHGQPLVTDALVEWLGHAPAALRVRIARLVAESGGPIEAAVLTRLLSDRDHARRAAYVRLFVQAEATDHAPLLLPLLDDGAADVRDAAVFVLSNSRNQRTWSALLTHYVHAQGSTRLTALRAIADGLAHDNLRLEARSRKDPRLEKLPTALADDLQSGDDARASLALQALGSMGTEPARALVRGALTSGSVGRRIAALRASLTDHGRAASRARRALIDDPDPRVAATAVVALALAGDPLPLSWLVSQIDRASWPLGPAASFALAEAFQRETGSKIALDLCPLLASREPISRHNLTLSWSRTKTGCAIAAPSQIDTTRFSPTDRTLPRDEPTSSPGALLLEDSRLLVSWPDGSGQIDWPRANVAARGNAWPEFYAPP